MDAGTCLEKIETLKQKLSKAEAVVIGAGAGLSTAAGFSYSGERFLEHFSDFVEKYRFPDMYSGGFHPFDTMEEHWAYWSRYIYINRYMDPPKPVYDRLFELVKEKDYFVLNTNVDHCFQKAGFDKKRMFYTQGDYGLWQCSKPCNPYTYDNKNQIMNMLKEQKNRAIPTKLLPKCPICGAPMTMNLRADATFVQDEGWYAHAKLYDEFMETHQNENILFLELGVGFNTPGIIKYPFWKMVHKNKNATYACINLGEAVAPKEIEKKSICIADDIDTVLQKLI